MKPMIPLITAVFTVAAASLAMASGCHTYKVRLEPARAKIIQTKIYQTSSCTPTQTICPHPSSLDMTYAAYGPSHPGTSYPQPRLVSLEPVATYRSARTTTCLPPHPSSLAITYAAYNPIR